MGAVVNLAQAVPMTAVAATRRTLGEELLRLATQALLVDDCRHPERVDAEAKLRRDELGNPLLQSCGQTLRKLNERGAHSLTPGSGFNSGGGSASRAVGAPVRISLESARMSERVSLFSSLTSWMAWTAA